MLRTAAGWIAAALALPMLTACNVHRVNDRVVIGHDLLLPALDAMDKGVATNVGHRNAARMAGNAARLRPLTAADVSGRADPRTDPADRLAWPPTVVSVPVDGTGHGRLGRWRSRTPHAHRGVPRTRGDYPTAQTALDATDWLAPGRRSADSGIELLRAFPEIVLAQAAFFTDWAVDSRQSPRRDLVYRRSTHARTYRATAELDLDPGAQREPVEPAETAASSETPESP